MPTVRAVPNIKAGTLGRRVILYTPSDVTDAEVDPDTDAAITWTPFTGVPGGLVWAAVEPLSGTAVGAPTANLQGVVTYLVRIRYLPGVVNGMRIYEPSTGLDLDILAVINIGEAQRHLHLECSSRRYPPV